MCRRIWTLISIASHFTFIAMAEDVVFYGNLNDAKAIRSSIAHSLEMYRIDLGTVMNGMDSILSEADTLSDTLDMFDEVNADWRATSLLIPQLHERNENVANDLLCNNKPRLTIALLNQPSISYFSLSAAETSHVSNTSSYTSVQQLLIHLGRDWGDIGEEARRETYTNGILAALSSSVHHLDVNDVQSKSGSLRVLVPGAGMGRLAMELSAAGYNVEANECSGPMVHAMHALLTKFLPAHAAAGNARGANEFFPFLHFDLMDEWDYSDRMKPSMFPSQDCGDVVKWILARRQVPGTAAGVAVGDFSVKFGDFLSAYGYDQAKDSFDVIVTSFFIDTFSNIIEPLLVVQHILKPGGLWINAGPLHFHGKPKLPFSYRQVERLITSLNFTKILGKTIKSPYYGEERNFMKPQIYNFPLGVWKKDDINPNTDTVLQKMETNRESRVKMPHQPNNSQKFTMVPEKM